MPPWLSIKQFWPAAVNPETNFHAWRTRWEVFRSFSSALDRTALEHGDSSTVDRIQAIVARASFEPLGRETVRAIATWTLEQPLHPAPLKWLPGVTVHARVPYEAEIVHEDVFGKGAYNLITPNRKPVVIDCGGHIGLSTLFFVERFSGARITVFEPNPDTRAVLVANVHRYGIHEVRDVKIEPGAVSDRDGTIDLWVGKDPHVEWPSKSTMDPNLWPNTQQDFRPVAVSMVRLSSRITEPVDILKLDIEGAEMIVLQDLAQTGKLKLVNSVLMEFHGHDPSAAVALLEQAGFNVEAPEKSPPNWMVRGYRLENGYKPIKPGDRSFWV